MFKQYGIELSRKTMSDWVLKSAILFEPLIQRMHKRNRHWFWAHARCKFIEAKHVQSKNKAGKVMK